MPRFGAAVADAAFRAPSGPNGSSILVLKRFLDSFGFLHSFNSVLSAIFSFVQLVIFAHVLPSETYSKVVMLTAIGFFLKPIDQAVGRANFIALREDSVRGAHSGPRQEVVAFLYGQAALIVAVSAVLPLWIEGGAHHYLQDVLFLSFALFTNFWSFDLQTTAWSVDLPKEFVRLTLAQRLIFFAGLAALWITRNFLLFTVVAAITTALFLILAARLLNGRSGVLAITLRFPGMTWAALRAHGKLFWTSLLTTLSELVVLNSAYGLISAMFGVGAAIVTFDSIMKIARLAMTGSRTLAEIALPRYSRMVIEQDRVGSKRLFFIVLGVCLAATAIPSLALVFAGQRIFALLLGHNNVVPSSAGLVAGIIVLISGLYQPVLFFLGFANARREIQNLTIASIIGFAIFAAAVVGLKLTMMEMLWAYAIYFAGASIGASLMLNRAEGYSRSPLDAGAPL